MVSSTTMLDVPIRGWRTMMEKFSQTKFQCSIYPAGIFMLVEKCFESSYRPVDTSLDILANVLFKFFESLCSTKKLPRKLNRPC